MTAAFEGWACVELFGHRVLYGHFTEVTVCGETFARIDIPTDPPTFELKNGKAIYGIRPATEEVVRRYHAPQRPDRQLAASDAELVDDVQPDPTPQCGGCGNGIYYGEPTEEVEVDNDDVETWHEQCAKEHAEPDDDDDPITPLDCVDSDAPRSST